MLSFYILSLAVLAVTTIWLWHEGRQRSRFVYALYVLSGFFVAQAGLTQLGILQNEWLILASQLGAWAVLLWAGEMRKRLISSVLAGLLFFSALPFVPTTALSTWGFITAVPLTAHLFMQRRTGGLPILTPIVRNMALRPVSVHANLSTDLLHSQRPVLECLNDGVLVSGNMGTIEYSNQAAQLILGLDQEQMYGQPITHVLNHMPMMGKEASQFEVKGRIIQGQMSIIYNEKGIAKGTVAFLRDVTERQQAELARDTFLTTISHELRTPLTSIKGYTELLNSGSAGELTTQQQMFMQTIQRNVQKMVNMINNLIFASTIRSGRFEYQDGMTDLSQLVPQLVREMSAKVAQRNRQTIELELDGRLRPIQADPLHMETILQELITNALKYSPAGGEVKILVQQEESPSGQQSFAVISIQDQGEGIAPQDQARIFEEFYHPDRSDMQVRAGGLGMGLAIVRALIEAYNGRIWFDTTPSGTTFTFVIPIQQQTVADAEMEWS